MYNYWQILVNSQVIVNVVLLLKDQSKIGITNQFLVDPFALCPQILYCWSLKSKLLNLKGVTYLTFQVFVILKLPLTETNL